MEPPFTRLAKTFPHILIFNYGFVAVSVPRFTRFPSPSLWSWPTAVASAPDPLPWLNLQTVSLHLKSIILYILDTLLTVEKRTNMLKVKLSELKYKQDQAGVNM